jgi:DNA-binding NarL/FixJ family response regulator
MQRVSPSRHGWRQRRSGEPTGAQQTHQIGDATAQGAATPYGLTQSELRVLHLLVEGLQDRQIAMRLGVTVHTVNKHVGAVLLKMNVRSRTAAAVRALREHLFVFLLVSML